MLGLARSCLVRKPAACGRTTRRLATLEIGECGKPCVAVGRKNAARRLACKEKKKQAGNEKRWERRVGNLAVENLTDLLVYDWLGGAGCVEKERTGAG